MTRCRRIAVVLSLAVIAAGLIILAGWTLGVPSMTSAFLGSVSTSPLSAVGLLTAGTALLLLLKSTRVPPASRDIVVFLGGLTSLFGIVMAVTRGIESKVPLRGIAAQVSAASSGASWLSRLSLVVIGAVIVMVRRSRFVPLSQALTHGLGLAAFTVIAGLLFNVDAVGSMRLVVGTGTASAAGFMALAAGLILAQPTHGLGALVVSNSSGGRLARLLLIPVAFVPVALHWVELLAERNGVYPEGVGWVLDGTLIVLILGALVWWTAARLERVDLERIDALDKLAESEERYRRLMESSPDAVVVKERDRVALVNNAALELLGSVAREDVIGRSLFAFVHPEDRERFERTCRMLVDGKDMPGAIEERLMRLDGSALDLEVSASVLEVRGRQLAQIVARDITQRKAESRALQESEERFRLIAETISEVFWMADIKLGKPVYVSPAYERIWGAPRGELGDNLEAFLGTIYPADKDRVIRNLSARHAGLPFEHEYRIIRPDGEVRWIWGRGFPVPNPNGPVRYYVGAAQDITERKRSEETARRSLERFELVARATGDALWDIDLTNLVGWWSDTYREYYGYRRDTVPSMEAWAAHIHPDDRERVIRGFYKAIDRNEPTWRDEYRYKRADGSYADVVDRAYSMVDADGNRRMVGAIVDTGQTDRPI